MRNLVYLAIILAMAIMAIQSLNAGLAGIEDHQSRQEAAMKAIYGE